jgi:hypothetical protein
MGGKQWPPGIVSDIPRTTKAERQRTRVVSMVKFKVVPVLRLPLVSVTVSVAVVGGWGVGVGTRCVRSNRLIHPANRTEPGLLFNCKSAYPYNQRSPLGKVPPARAGRAGKPAKKGTTP